MDFSTCVNWIRECLYLNVCVEPTLERITFKDDMYVKLIINHPNVKHTTTLYFYISSLMTNLSHLEPLTKTDSECYTHVSIEMFYYILYIVKSIFDVSCEIKDKDHSEFTLVLIDYSSFDDFEHEQFTHYDYKFITKLDTCHLIEDVITIKKEYAYLVSLLLTSILRLPENTIFGSYVKIYDTQMKFLSINQIFINHLVLLSLFPQYS